MTKRFSEFQIGELVDISRLFVFFRVNQRVNSRRHVGHEVGVLGVARSIQESRLKGGSGGSLIKSSQQWQLFTPHRLIGTIVFTNLLDLLLAFLLNNCLVGCGETSTT